MPALAIWADDDLGRSNESLTAICEQSRALAAERKGTSGLSPPNRLPRRLGLFLVFEAELELDPVLHYLAALYAGR
jgi:hypothetical protein